MNLLTRDRFKQIHCWIVDCYQLMFCKQGEITERSDLAHSPVQLICRDWPLGDSLFHPKNASRPRQTVTLESLLFSITQSACFPSSLECRKYSLARNVDLFESLRQGFSRHILSWEEDDRLSCQP